jgi:flagellar basal-body rod protein FlgB
MIPKLTESLDFHAQALALRAERQRVIAGNIANADTPGYKARDFNFATALRDATAARGGSDAGRGGDGVGSGIGSSIGAGIAQGVMQPGGQTPTALRYVQPVQTNLDSNTVDMDRERGAFMDNALKYDATLRFINGNVRTALDAMKSHNQG